MKQMDTNLAIAQPSLAPNGMKMMLNMGYTPGLGLGRDLDGERHHAFNCPLPKCLLGQVSPLPLVLKRKRDEGGLGSDRHRSASPARLILEKLDGAFVKLESKKAKKRRRRLIGDSLKYREHQNSFDYPPPPSPQPDAKLRGWQDDPNNGMHQPLPDPSHRRSPSYHLPPTHDSDSSWSSHPIAPNRPLRHVYSSSDVINGVGSGSVAPKPVLQIAAGLPARPAFDHAPLEPQSALYPVVPMGPLSHLGPSRSPTSPVSPHSLKGHNSNQSAPTSPRWKKITSTPHFDNICPPSSRSADGRLHVYDPTRTIVLEQLPKHKRNRQFLLKWCQNTCGAVPVRLDLDTSRKEALVEFESAEIAKKVYSSPLPRTEPGGAVMRLRWYRIYDDPRDGEVEEGEIEDNDGTLRNRWLTKGNKSEKKARKREPWKHERDISTDTPPKYRATVAADHHHPQPVPPSRSPARSAPKHPPTRARSGSAKTFDTFLDPDRPAIRDTRVRSFQIPVNANDPSASPSLPTIPQAIHSAKQDSDTIPKDMDLETPASHHFGVTLPTVDQIESSPTVGKSELSVLPVSTPRRSRFQLRRSPPIVSPLEFPVTESGVCAQARVIKVPPRGPTHARERGVEENSGSDIRMKHLGYRDTRKPTQDETEQETAGRCDTVQSLSPDPPITGSVSNEMTVETDLRRLVLESKKGKAASLTVNQNASISETDHRSSMMSHSTDATSIVSLTSFHCSSPESYSDSGDSEPPPVQDSIALEELAVSFITETIEAIKLPAKPSAAAMKLELLTRQQQLEKEIAESKMLMAKLTSAQTKEEKDDILRAMRERTRCVSGC